MSDSEFDTTMDQIVESIAERLERGESPSIEEYKRQYPHLAERIEAVLPALVLLDHVDTPSDRKLALDDSVPRILGEYEIIQEIGRGGMGIVFEAKHQTMRRRVALKVLPKSAADRSNYLNRFLTEARSAGQLHHTNIVPVFEVGEAEGLHYYAMQYIHGDNLDRVIDDIRRLRAAEDPNLPASAPAAGRQNSRRADSVSHSVAAVMIRGGWQSLSAVPAATQPAGDDGLPPLVPATGDNDGSGDQSVALSDSVFGRKDNSTTLRTQSIYHRRVAAVGAQVAAALEHAHSHGVLHRDIKPANLILDTDGTVWVTDFGLAKLESDDLTHTGDIIGTLRYMAPERFEGQADRRSDVYSLGLTLYELCTLRSAFDNDRGNLVDTATTRVVTPPGKVDPTIPSDLETIILKACERQPDRRYQTCQDLADDLQLFLEDRPIRARRASFLERCWRVCRRNPLAAGMGVCIALLGLVVAVGSLRYGMLASERARYETQSRRTLQEQLYHANVDQARMRRYSARMGQRVESLAALQRAVALLPDLTWSAQQKSEARLTLRNEALAAVSLIDLHPLWSHTFPEDRAPGAPFSISDDATLFCEGFPSGIVKVRKLADASLVAELPAPFPGTPAWRLAFGANARHLMAHYHQSNAPPADLQTCVWDLESPSAPLITLQATTDTAFSHDGSRFAAIQGNHAAIFALEDGRQIRKISPDFLPHGRPHRIVFRTPSMLAVSQLASGVVEFWDAEGESDRRDRIEIEGIVFSLACDPKRKIFVIGGDRGGLFYWRGDIAGPPQQVRRHQNTVTRLCLHPRRELLVSEAWDSTVRLTDLLSGAEVMRLNDVQLLANGFCNDGLGIRSATSEVSIWQLSAPLVDVYKSARGNGWQCRFHPMHPHILAAVAGRNIEFWDTRKKRLLHVLQDVHVRDMHYAPDGASLYVSGDAGLQRWEIVGVSSNGDASIQLRGPITLVGANVDRMVLNSTADIAVVSIDGAPRAVQTSSGQIAVQFGDHRGLSRLQITADDKHLLTGTWKGQGIKIWDMQTGKLVKTVLEDLPSITVATPHPNDVDVFVTSYHGLRRFGIRSAAEPDLVEHPLLTAPGLGVFSPDGQLFAVGNGSYEVILVATSNWQPVARIETVGPSRIIDFDFSPDGRQIGLACYDSLQLVELAEIRSTLQELGLDW